MPERTVAKANLIFEKALASVEKIHSSRAMACIIKGLYYRNISSKYPADISLIKILFGQAFEMYLHETNGEWPIDVAYTIMALHSFTLHLKRKPSEKRGRLRSIDSRATTPSMDSSEIDRANNHVDIHSFHQKPITRAFLDSICFIDNFHH